MNLSECDEKVYRKGKLIALLRLGAEAAEAVVKDKARYAPNSKVDWHYVGGRAVVKAIGPEDELSFLKDSFHSFSCAYRCSKHAWLEDGTPCPHCAIKNPLVKAREQAKKALALLLNRRKK